MSTRINGIGQISMTPRHAMKYDEGCAMAPADSRISFGATDCAGAPGPVPCLGEAFHDSVPRDARDRKWIQARALCNGVFLSGIERKRIEREDIGFNPFFRLMSTRIDRQERSVAVSMLGGLRNKAVVVDGLGSVLLSGAPEESVRSWRPEVPAPGLPIPHPRPGQTATLCLPLRQRPASISSASPTLRTATSRRSSAGRSFAPEPCSSFTKASSCSSAMPRVSRPIQGC